MDLCDSDLGDGCGLVFLNKSSSGLCGKCAKLATLKDGSPEFNQYKLQSVCVMWVSLEESRTPKCGRCMSLSVSVPGTDDTLPSLTRVALEASRAARVNDMQARLTKQPASASSALHTTAGLTSAKSSMPTGENKIVVSVECRIKTSSRRDQKTTDFDCGKWAKAYPKEAYLSEILDEYLITLNGHWVKEYGRALIRDEVEFRWSGNKIFSSGTASKSIGEIYSLYLTRDMVHFYKPESGRPKKASGGRAQYEMALELYINKPKFILRLKGDQLVEGDVGSSLPARKRSATRSEYVGDDLPIVKRPSIFSGVPLTSTFIRTRHVSSAAVDTSSVVRIKKAHTTCDKDTGEVNIGWPENGRVDDGLIEKMHFAQGATKYVYKLSIGATMYVAKRFFELGLEEEVTAAQNKDNLEKELIRLKTTGWFLAKFKLMASKADIEYHEDITVSEGFIVCEIGSPSAASSLPPFPEDSAVWLVEPRRTTSVQKFSGTMSHPDRSDKVGKTLVAFAHFIFEDSGEEIVVADIQGSPKSINGKDVLVIFDPMSHSRDGDSGIGDHGQEGIEAFVSQHRCNYICKGLKLSMLRCSAGKQDGDSNNAEGRGSLDEKDELDSDQ